MRVMTDEYHIGHEHLKNQGHSQAPQTDFAIAIANWNGGWQKFLLTMASFAGILRFAGCMQTAWDK